MKLELSHIPYFFWKNHQNYVYIYMKQIHHIPTWILKGIILTIFLHFWQV
jgi:hypothetical protein